jgi:hypothetical protein
MGGVHPDLRGPFSTPASNNAGHGMQDQFRMGGHADMRSRFSTLAGHHHHAYPGMVPDTFHGHGQQYVMGGGQYPNLRGPFTTPGLQHAFSGPPDPIHGFGQHPGYLDPRGGYGVHGNNGMRGAYECDCSRCLHALRGGAITLTTVNNVNMNIHGLRRREHY